MQKIIRKPNINLILFIASLFTTFLIGMLALKKGENISFDEEKKLVLNEAIEVLKDWSKFKESQLLY